MALLGLRLRDIGCEPVDHASDRELFLIGLPALLLGTWAGFALYGRIDEGMFRRIVLWLLLASGIFLLATFR